MISILMIMILCRTCLVRKSSLEIKAGEKKDSMKLSNAAIVP